MRTAIEEVVVLRRQNEMLSERVAYLEGQLSTLAETCPSEWKLTKSEARLMGLLVHANGKTVERTTLITAMWGDNEPEAPRILDVLVYKIRKKVMPFGVIIRVVWGIGFFVEYNRIAQDVR